MELVQLSETIRKERQHRVREIEYERQQQTEIHDHRQRRGGWERDNGWESDRGYGGGRARGFDDERVVEREVVYSSTGGGRQATTRRY